MKKELKELIGILNYKEWGFRMYKKLIPNEYVIGIILGNEELECNVYDEKGLKALMFDVINFNKDEYNINIITDRFEEFLNICINTNTEVEFMNISDFDYRYNFECECVDWVIRVVIENDVYIIPSGNTEFISSLIFRLTSPYTSDIKYNGHTIIADSEFGVLRFKVEIRDRFVVFDNIEYAKKFIDNNMKGE